MEVAKLFENGRSQAVRLPKQFRFTGDEVFAKKIGNVVMLMPKTDLWDTFLNGINGFTDDIFADGRMEIAVKREAL